MSRTKLITKTLLAAALMLGGAVGASAAPVFTTDFSEYSPVNPYDEVMSGTYGNITVGGGGVDWVGTYWQAPGEGQNSVDMNRRDAGALSISVPNLTQGQQYALTFSLAGNPDSLIYDTNHVKGLQVSNGTTSQNYYFNVANALGAGIPSTNANMGWVGRTFYFTAQGGDVLTFSSLNSGSMWGAALGNLSISAVGSNPGAVPEPSTVLLMGAGLAGLFVARRRRLV